MPMDMDFAFFDALKNYIKGMYGGAAVASTVGGMCMVAPEAYYFGMRNPEMIGNGLDFIESYLPGSPVSSFAGASGFTAGYFYGYEKW